MNEWKLSRRQILAGAVVGAGAMAAGGGEIIAASQARKKSKAEPFGYCLNTATIMGQNLSLVEEIDIVSKAGYDSIEPWIRKIKEHKDKGGSLKDIKKRLGDLNLSVESTIGFAGWIADDEAERARGLEQFKRDMDMVAQIGGKRIAAPPVGATRGAKLDLLKAAKRYRVLLELGDEFGVVPQVEVWGHSVNLHRLGESMFVVIESGHPKACLLPDFYHIYKGGSDFTGLKMLSGDAIQVFHMNDYPGMDRKEIGDKDRVMPGDGVAPLPKLLKEMRSNGCVPVLSLELFNREYWGKDAMEVAKVGLAKMKSVVYKSNE